MNLGRPVDFSGPQSPPAQVRGVDPGIPGLSWPVMFSPDRPPPWAPHSALRPGSVPREGSVLTVHPRAEASSPQRAVSPHLGASGVRLSPANCAWCGPPPTGKGGLEGGGRYSGCVPRPHLHDPQPHVHELPPAHPELFSGTFRPVDGSLRERSCSGCRDVQFLSRAFSHEIRQPGSLGGDGAQPGFVLLFPGGRPRPVCPPPPPQPSPPPPSGGSLGACLESALSRCGPSELESPRKPAGPPPA